MTGYIVQIGEEFLNWQGLLTSKNYAIILSEPDAKTLASAHASAIVVAIEYEPKPDSRTGTYFEYHKEF